MGPAGAYGEYHRRISSLPCFVSGRPTQTVACEGEVHGHHVRPVGGGNGDIVALRGEDGVELVGNEFPVCYRHHRQVEDELGPEGFEEKHGWNVYDLARWYGERIPEDLEEFCRDEWLEFKRLGG